MSTQLPFVFDPTKTPPATGSAGQLPVSGPHGYKVVITGADIVQNSDPSSGSHVAITLEVADGDNKGVEGTHRLNMGHVKPDVARIANSELSAICHAVKWLQPLQDLSVLFNKPFCVVVDFQKDAASKEKGYTEIRKILNPDGSRIGSSGPPDQPSSAPQGPPPPSAPPQQPAQIPPQPQYQTAPPQQPQFNAQPPQQGQPQYQVSQPSQVNQPSVEQSPPSQQFPTAQSGQVASPPWGAPPS